VLTHPSVGATSVSVESRADSVSRPVSWGSSIGVVECEAGHYPGVAVSMGQIEGSSHLVVFRHFVSEDISTTGSVSALVIVVVDECQGTATGHESPALAPVFKVGQFVISAENTTNLSTESEFSDTTNAQIFRVTNTLTT
jgi:hypothetical protein